MKRTITERYEMYIAGNLYMMFDEETAIMRFVNRMHKVNLFTDIEIIRVKTITERSPFETSYL